MKKEYAKPFLAVESFQLDAALAGACKDAGALELIGPTADKCIKDLGGGDIIFSFACAQQNGDDITHNDSNDELCYQAFQPSIGSVMIYS